jgi:hypothetical protein
MRRYRGLAQGFGAATALVAFWPQMHAWWQAGLVGGAGALIVGAVWWMAWG